MLATQAADLGSEAHHSALAADSAAPMHRACSIAVAGGGISGLSCAHKLLQLLPNAQASVIDMGRSGPGMPSCSEMAWLCIHLSHAGRETMRRRPGEKKLASI